MGYTQGKGEHPWGNTFGHEDVREIPYEDERGFCSLEAWEEMLAPLTTSEVVQSGTSYVARETLHLWLP